MAGLRQVTARPPASVAAWSYGLNLTREAPTFLIASKRTPDRDLPTSHSADLLPTHHSHTQRRRVTRTPSHRQDHVPRLFFLLSQALPCASFPALHNVVAGLVGTGHIEKAAIISAAGDSEWATSAGFKLEPTEMKAIADILSDASGARDRAYSEGLYIAKQRYVMANADENTIYARHGRSGICIAKSQQAILVGLHNEGQIAGNASAAIGALVDYLKPLGY
ncbi:hypothetical protein RB597_002550 [Gaeumannomyces tritici]